MLHLSKSKNNLIQIGCVTDEKFSQSLPQRSISSTALTTRTRSTMRQLASWTKVTKLKRPNIIKLLKTLPVSFMEWMPKSAGWTSETQFQDTVATTNVLRQTMYLEWPTRKPDAEQRTAYVASKLRRAKLLNKPRPSFHRTSAQRKTNSTEQRNKTSEI